jgi:hypothetical protein
VCLPDMARHPILILWAVPRSASTAFERMMIERGDHRVVDEPFSAHYYFGEEKVSSRFELVEPGSRPHEIVTSLIDVAEQQPLFVKDMAYHAIDFVTTELVATFRNAFLIREPVGAIASLARRWPDFTDEEAGFEAVASMAERVGEAGQDLVVIDQDDLCRNPAGIVSAYCERMGIPFLEDALSWAPGMRPEWERWSDWHESSAASTGFEAAKPPETDNLPARVRDVVARCRPIYEALHERRLRSAAP